MNSEERLVNLEIKISHQDKTLDDLSAEIYQLHLQIEALNKVITELKNRQSDSGTEIRGNEKPPHY